MANSDFVQHRDISEHPIPLTHIGTWISFTLITEHRHHTANSTDFLDFNIIPPDVLLLHYAFYDDSADARILMLNG